MISRGGEVGVGPGGRTRYARRTILEGNVDIERAIPGLAPRVIPVIARTMRDLGGILQPTSLVAKRHLLHFWHPLSAFKFDQQQV